MKTSPALCVFVCGSVDRGDDGAAVIAVGRLLARLDRGRLRTIAIERCGQLDVQDLLDVPAGTPVLIVDAAAGIRAGRLVKRSLDELIDHRRGPAPRSSHALPINQLLGIVNVLVAEPLRGYFVGIGGADFSPGSSLSPQVAREMPAFIDAVGAAIDELAPPAPVAPRLHTAV